MGPGGLLLQLAWLRAAAAALEGPSDLGDAVALVQQLQPVAMRHLFQFTGTLRMKHRPVFWLHMPEAGASIMCQTAKANGEKLMYSADKESCNWQPYDDFRATPPTRMPNCKDRARTWAASAFTWSQIERPLSKEDLCGDKFIYATIFRHPVATVKSLIRSFNSSSAQPGQDPMSILNCLDALRSGKSSACASAAFSPATDAYWRKLDNPMVRILGGPEVWALPPGGVNTTHELQAIAVLSQFDLALPFDEYSKNQSKEILMTGFGWRDLGAMDAHVNAQTLLLAGTVTDLEASLFQRVNEHDLNLYNSFKAVVLYNSLPWSVSNTLHLRDT